MTPPRHVTSTDGVQLAVYEQGRPDGPVVVALHGYPDDHRVWDAVATLLGERCRVITYDVRGMGASERPATRDAYRMSYLIDDLVQVVDEVADGPVHLLAHDWGSLQAWAALPDDRLAGRITTFTSISGPALDYAAGWLRDVRQHPRDTLRQAARSSYVPVFLLPRLPELAIRRGVLDRLSGHAARRADQLAGLQLYRANIPYRGRPRRIPSSTRVQLLLPERDPFITAAFAAGSARPWVAQLVEHRIAGGHWPMVESPETVADLVSDFVGA